MTHDTKQAPVGTATETNAPQRVSVHQQVGAASVNQRRLVFLQGLNPASSFYNVAVQIGIEGALDSDRLVTALHRVVSRHEALRTSFGSAADGSLLQIVGSATNWQVERLSAADRPKARAHAAQAAKTPFDLTEPSLFRATLISIGEHEHLLVLVVHHAVIDAWSLDIVLRELSAVYNASSGGGDEPAPSYLAAATEQLLSPAEQSAALDYWQRSLAGLATRPAFGRRDGTTGATAHLNIDAADHQRLRDQAGFFGCTPFVLILTAFAKTVSHLSGQSRFAIGCPFANRRTPTARRTVGFFANTLPVPFELSPGRSTAELIESVADAFFDAVDHGGVPLESIVAAVNPDRSAQQNPLFEVTCQQQNVSAEALDLTSCRCELSHIDKGTSQFALSLDVFERGTEFDLAMEYSVEVFSERRLRQFTVTLRAALREVMECAAPSARTWPDVLVVDRDEPSLPPQSQPGAAVVERLVESFARHSDRRAIEHGHTVLSYAELGALTAELVSSMRTAGAMPGARVFVQLGRGVRNVAAMLAVLSIGATYCPGDERMSPSQLYRAVESLQAGVYVDADGVRPINASRSRSVDIDEAYIVHTSGTTGAAKAAMVTYFGLHQWLEAITSQLQPQPDDVVLQFAAPGFDVALEEVLPSLLAGASLVIPTLAELADPAAFLNFTARLGVSVANLPCSYWHRVVDALSDETATGRLRLLILGSETLDPTRLARWRQRTRGVTTLLHAYGTSECTVTCSLLDITDRVVEAGRSVPIGPGLSHARVSVLADDQTTAPVGTPGEVVITAVTGTWGSGEPVHHTGDIGVLQADGTIELHGRRDASFKKAGVSVAPERIEDVVRAGVRAVDEIAVLPTDDGRLIYLVQAQPGSAAARDARERDSETVDAWAAVHDDERSNQLRPGADPTRNTSGWVSAISCEPLDDAVMLPWIDATVQRIRELTPKRVLEIGCGTGMMLFRLAGDCQEYVATDISQRALDHVAATIAAYRPELAHVRLVQAPAHQLPELDQIDVVILNSVVQYFPSVDYLSSVLADLGTRLAENAWIFLGDVRDADRRFELYAEMERSQWAGGVTLAGLLARDEAESELLFSPRAFFSPALYTAATPTAVQVLGRHELFPRSELSDYRFDVRLRYASGGQQEISTRAGSQPSMVVTDEQTLLAAFSRAQPQICWEVPATSGVLGPVEVALGATRPESISATADVCRLIAEGARRGYRAQSRYDADRVAFVIEFSSRATPVESTSLAAPVLREPAGHSGCLWTSPGRRAAANELRQQVAEVVRKTFTPEALPSAVLVLGELPRASDGQLRRSLLRELAQQTPSEASQADGALGDDDRAIGQPVAAALSEAWRGVLGVRAARPGDNFFVVGGDSIRALQLANRLTGAGVEITPADIFTAQTLGELSTLLTERGSLPSPAEPRRERPDGATEVGRAWRQLREHQPLVRWFQRQQFYEPDWYVQSRLLEFSASPSVTVVRDAISQVLQRHQLIEQTSDDVPMLAFPEGTFDVSTHDSVRSRVTEQRVFAYGVASVDDRVHSVLLVAHHLVVDAVSWNVLLDDLDRALTGGDSSLGPPPRCPELRRPKAADVEYWREYLADVGVPQLPEAEPGARTGNHAAQMSLLTASELKTLRDATGEAFEGALLAAVGEALCRWLDVERTLVDREIHGRDLSEFGDAVGWFATMHPLQLRRGSGLRLAEARAIDNDLRRMPACADGYLNGPLDVVAQQAELPIFVAFTGAGPESGYRHFRLVQPSDAAVEVAPTNVSQYAAEVLISLGEGQLAGLAVTLVTDRTRVSAVETQRLLDYLAAAFDVDADAWLEPVSHDQATMLLQHASQPQTPTGVEQTQVTLRGALSAEQLQVAVDKLIARHPVLRSAFVVTEHQVGRRLLDSARCPVEFTDLTGSSLHERTTTIRAATLKATSTPFSLSTPPLMRIAAFRLDADQILLIWTHHHVVLDGWSSWMFLHELVATCSGRHLELNRSAQPRRLEAQPVSVSAGVEHWTRQLALLADWGDLDFSAAGAAGAAPDLRTTTLTWEQDQWHNLQQAARSAAVTPGSLLQTAWALTLMRLTGAPVVAFSTTLSIRSAEQEQQLGDFTRRIPVIVSRPDDDDTAADFVQGVQALLAQDRQWAFTDLSRLPGSESLLRRPGSHLLFQNYPRPKETPAPGDVEIVTVKAVVNTGDPVTVAVTPLVNGVSVEVTFDATRVRLSQARSLLSDLSDTADDLVLLLSDVLTPVAALIERPASTVAATTAVAGTTAAPPRTIREVFDRLVENGPMPPNANFFDAGLDSRRLLQARADLERLTKRPVPITLLYRYPSVVSLERQLTRSATEAAIEPRGLADD